MTPREIADARHLKTRVDYPPLPAKTISAADQQVGGDHYRTKAVQPWQAMQAWMTPEQFAGFLRGNAIKYLARCDDKGGVEDLKKARHYLDRLIELLDTLK